ncbi:MAG TPA: glycine cleavage system protein GcvH [Anaerolineales bacterium]|nr:glycine cleavage system protein GcvH [Anaerolineales bacterium]
MATVRGCNIPEDRYYWVEKHCWATLEADGTVKIGITDVAQNLAKGIVNATPKDAGRTVQKGKSAGTLESGKWVGPVTSPVTGEIVEVNEAMKGKPSLINSDPYGEGWFVRVKPNDWAGESASLVTGEAAVAAYQKFMEEQNLNFE